MLVSLGYFKMWCVILFCLKDSSVIQLTQDLAKILGLKIRKAYVRTKVYTPPAYRDDNSVVVLAVVSVCDSA